MEALNALLLVLLMAGGGHGVAVPSTQESKTFTVPATLNDNFKPNGPMALARAYLKFGTPVPHGLSVFMKNATRQQKRDTGTVTAFPQPDAADREYLAQVDIGTPPQTLYLDFDTGSSDLWVFSSETPRSQVKGQTVWDISRSITARRLPHHSWSIKYKDHSNCRGDVYADVVNIGNLSVEDQAVQSAQNVSPGFTNGPRKTSGVLGLAFDKLNTIKPTRQKTWFSNIQSSLDAPLFTSHLKKGANGSYNFGYIDKTQYTGDITYTAISDNRGFWSWTATGYGVGGGSLNNLVIHAIADTGTSLLLLPGDVVDDYWSNVDGATLDPTVNIYVFPCAITPPDFVFGVEDQTITVPGSYMSYGRVYDDDMTTCFGGIQSNNGGPSLFGDIALKASFVVFDVGNKRLGWAQGA